MKLIKFEMLARGIAARKPIGLGDDPVGELSAVAAALDSEAVGVDPGVTLECRVHPHQNVPGLTPILIAEDGVPRALGRSR